MPEARTFLEIFLEIEIQKVLLFLLFNLYLDFKSII